MSNRALLQEHAGAADLLAAERAEEVGDEPVHELEIRRQRRRILLRVVQDLFPVTLRVHRRAGAAVDEYEFRAEDEALPFHVGADRPDASAAEVVVNLLVALHESGARAIG